MAHGVNANENLIYVKIRSRNERKETDPHFVLSIPQNDSKRVEEKVTWIDGHVTKVETGEYEWNGEMISTIIIFLQDGEHKYKLEASWTGLVRGLVNSLLGIETMGRVCIRLYTSKEGYASVYVENNGERASWKYKWEDQKDMVRTYKGKGGKEEADFTELNKWFAGKADTELSKKVKP